MFGWRCLLLGALQAGILLTNSQSEIYAENSRTREIEQSSPSDDNSVDIPLSTIWAHGIPNTKAMRAGYSREVAPEAPLLREIRLKYLMSAGAAPTVASPGFIVKETGMAALQNAHAIFTQQAKPKPHFAEGQELTLVFFSRSFSRATQLKRVTRTTGSIQVDYELVPYDALMEVDALALIPLGKLAAGKYKVKMHELPLSAEYLTKGHQPLKSESKKGIVADSFVFQIDSPE